MIVHGAVVETGAARNRSSRRSQKSVVWVVPRLEVEGWKGCLQVVGRKSCRLEVEMGLVVAAAAAGRARKWQMAESLQHAVVADRKRTAALAGQDMLTADQKKASGSPVRDSMTSASRQE